MNWVVPDGLRLGPRAGISLLETVVALLLLSAGMLAVTSAGSAVTRQLKVSRTENELWGAMQTVGDSLQQRGFGNVTNCLFDNEGKPCRVENGRYNFIYSVETNADDKDILTNLNRITLLGWVCEPNVTVCGPGTTVAPLREERVLIYLADI
jgi:hypothetical protein